MFFLTAYIPHMLAAACALLLLWNIRLEWRLHKMLKGKTGGSLEDSIVALGKRQEIVEEFKKDMEQYLTSVEKRLRSAVRGVSTVRFNPFKGDGSGGNQSFATAFVNEEGNGVVFSSLYARDRMSMFAKPIEKHASPYGLTEEEQTALSGAREKSANQSR